MRFLGRVNIFIAKSLDGFVLIEYVSHLKDDIDNPIVILAVIFLIGFAMSSIFSDVYAVTSLKILHCLYTDIDIFRQNREHDALNKKYRPAEM